MSRWQESDSTPMPKLTKMKADEVLDYLPKDTSRISSEDREANIRLRRRYAQMRQ